MLRFDNVKHVSTKPLCMPNEDSMAGKYVSPNGNPFDLWEDFHSDWKRFFGELQNQ